MRIKLEHPRRLPARAFPCVLRRRGVTRQSRGDVQQIKSNNSIPMSNIQIETDLAEILKDISIDQKEILKKVNALEVSLETVKGDIKAMDERLSGQIKSVDEKLSGQIKALDTKVEQLDKRIGNQEFTNRGVLIGLVVVILGGAAKFFGLVGNP